MEAQQANPQSLLWWMRRLIALRKRYDAFGRGTIEFLLPENRKVLTFLRILGDERILVVANLSRYAQYVELDLSQFQGMTPVAMLGGVEFPRIGELPYLLTLGPHDFYWFSLEQQDETGGEGSPLPQIELKGHWPQIVESARGKAALETHLPAWLLGRRWFGAKARRMRSAAIADVIRVPDPSATGAAPPAGYLVLVRAEFTEGDSETYLVPLTASALEGYTRAHASRLVARPAALRRRRARAARGAARAALRAGAARSDPRAQAPAGHGGCGRRVARPRHAEPARRDPRVDGAAGRAEQHVARVRRPPDPQAVSPGRGG